MRCWGKRLRLYKTPDLRTWCVGAVREPPEINIAPIRLLPGLKRFRCPFLRALAVRPYHEIVTHSQGPCHLAYGDLGMHDSQSIFLVSLSVDAWVQASPLNLYPSREHMTMIDKVIVHQMPTAPVPKI